MLLTGFNSIWKEEICMEDALHIYAWIWCRLWSHGSCFFNISAKISGKAGTTHIYSHVFILLFTWSAVKFLDFSFTTLTSSPWFPQVGYIVTSCLLNENHDFLRLAINAVRNDIIGRNETFQCLALTLVRMWYHNYDL